ncbi:MAG: restriction endonuclease subunit S [Proteobacteria bacterium]|nr:restriction endonuclease subunit S [Pseudomonadota bacterium]
MINKNDFCALLKYFSFIEDGDTFSKNFDDGISLSVDFKKEKLEYPEAAGLVINERQTCNFSSAENAVVFECVHKLLAKGYKPKHIELEPRWKVGHGASGGRADILVSNQNNKPLLLIECKTYGKEFTSAWKDTKNDGGQLFSYAQQIATVEFLCLYASKFDETENQILVEQRIISHKDNDQLIELGENLKSYAQASDVKSRFEVWKETYQLEYTETGIFEENIQPYQIGKNNYTLGIDTHDVIEQDKEGKYHQFRTILRQHNIARKETAFEVLVNLFLAKIVDEEENAEKLEFYWKGVAYDNYYDFIDRLQNLYQIGMKEFLKDEVMYISNKEIDNAFWTIKNKKNATKKQIQKYFRDLKFFSNNAFSLINVHNERLFRRNTKVLIELVQMWQGLRLKTEEQNQFLGDMFEHFLDNSIKQSEGQFFTPIPITKFIVASLPLEQKIQQSSEPLKAIDYACGAGHFLTEYAHQIKPLVTKYKQTLLNKYYENIIGIEKEDRLAKIAKVSAYMYGQDQIKIIEKDGLSEIENVQQASFDVLVANPPFAVEGFLLNLSDKQRENYELIETTRLNFNSNNIQCFFLEKAKQLMAGNGVVGVIVPSSVLSNSDSTHIATREIILKYFDIVALVELGSGTFGKTGTKTVVLFLRRKDKKPEPAEHYQNRVDDYFSGDAEQDQGEYQDSHLIQKYCEHNKLAFEEYKKLFDITPETIENINELLKAEIFSEYGKDFKNSTEIKNLKKSNNFKKMNPQEQALEINKRLINYLHNIEKDKLFYFILAYENPQKVLIVKSPSNSELQKKFLGYEWSNAKGSEGIKYNGGSTVNDIITPLFNPENLQDKSKINYLIEQNFLGKSPDNLSKFGDWQNLISYSNVTDILDFSRGKFNKTFSLSSKKNTTIESKWELVKLGEIAKLYQPKTITSEEIKETGPYKVFGANGVIGYYNEYNHEDAEIAITCRGATCGTINMTEPKSWITGNAMVVQPEKNILKKYLFEILNYIDLLHVITGSAQPQITRENLSPVIIPVPPKEVQEKIVTECKVIGKASKQAKQTIDNAEKEIEESFIATHSNANKTLRLSNSDIFEVSIGKRVITKEIEQTKGGIPVYSANVFEPFGHINKDLLINFDNPSVIWGIDGDWMVNYIAPNNPFYPTDHCGVLRVNENEINARYLTWLLDKAGQDISFSRSHRASIDRVKGLSIKVPKIEIQQKLVAKVERLEEKIKQARKTLKNAPEQKQQILDKYLK